MYFPNNIVGYSFWTYIYIYIFIYLFKISRLHRHSYENTNGLQMHWYLVTEKAARAYNNSI